MMDEGRQFQAELEAAHEAVVEHRRLSERLGVVQSALAAAQYELAQATEVLVGETAEVQKLESLSLTVIWASLRGERAERLAARQSAEGAAKARVAAARAAVDNGERELSAVHAGLDRLGDVDAWHAATLAVKETWAIQIGAHDRAGSLARGERRARSWPYDGRFILSDGRKADEMDQAVGLMRKAGALLRVLSRQIDGLGSDNVDRLVADDFVGTFDFLLDHQVNNKIFMNRIDVALVQVHEALDAIEQAHQSTDRRTAELDAQLADLVRRREQLLMSM